VTVARAPRIRSLVVLQVYVSNGTSAKAQSIPDVATASPGSDGSLMDADVYRAMRQRLKLEAAEVSVVSNKRERR